MQASYHTIPPDCKIAPGLRFIVPKKGMLWL